MRRNVNRPAPNAKSTASSFAKYGQYKTYFIVGFLVVVSTVVLGSLAGSGVFDSSSSSDENLSIVPSSSSTGVAPTSTGAVSSSSSTTGVSSSTTSSSSSSSSSNSGPPQAYFKFLASSFSALGTPDDTPVSSWVGINPNHIAVQGTANKRPLFKTSGLGTGFPSVYFDGGDALTGENVFPTNSPYSLITVLSQACTENFCNILASSSGNPGGHSLGLGQSGVSKVSVLHNNEFFNTPTATVPVNTPIVIAVTYSNTELKIYQNGVLVMTQTHDGSKPVLDSSICIGCTSNPTNYMFLGHISLIEGYNSVVDVVTRSNELKVTYNIA